ARIICPPSRSRCCSCKARATPSATSPCCAPSSLPCPRRRCTSSPRPITRSTLPAAPAAPTPARGPRSSRWRPAGSPRARRADASALRSDAVLAGLLQLPVIRPEPRQRRRFPLGDQAQQLARFGIVVEIVEHLDDGPGGRRVVGVARQQEAELLL